MDVLGPAWASLISASHSRVYVGRKYTEAGACWEGGHFHLPIQVLASAFSAPFQELPSSQNTKESKFRTSQELACQDLISRSYRRRQNPDDPSEQDFVSLSPRITEPNPSCPCC